MMIVKAIAVLVCYPFMVMPSEISKTILAEAEKRGPEKSTCPSEIARMLFGDDWRREMGQVREVAIGLHREGKVVITQKGLAIDVDHIKGPVRIKISETER